MTKPAKPQPSTEFVRYRDSLEQPAPDEDQIFKKIADALYANNERAYRKYRHGVRDAHAKGLGVLRGDLTVYGNLAEPYAQGLFATPATYPIIARLSSTSGLLRSDQTRGVRGLGIKVLGVHGARARGDDLEGADRPTTQDFILVTHREFPFADARVYSTRGMRSAWLLARLPDRALIVGGAAIGAIQQALERIGQSLPMVLSVFTEPNKHILGMTFHSSAPLRWGDYVAKVCVAPLSKSVVALENEGLPAGKDAFRDQVVEFFGTNSAEYEVRAQLCTDIATMPIEDATVEWKESESPHVPVGKISFPAQDPDTPLRREFGEDVLSFNSWQGLAAHRPLGSINRLKKLVYDSSSDFRHRVNDVAQFEPRTVADLPD